MSKIEDFHRAKEEVAALEVFVKVMEDDGFDKKGARIEKMDTWIGRYGSSGVSSWKDSVKKAIIDEMTNSIPALAKQALEKAKQKAEEKRIEAADEAREILKETEK